MSKIPNYPSASSLSSADLLIVEQSGGTKKTTVEGLAEKIGETVVSNRNLLDNPWFTVNQRGFTSTTSNGYTVDRWKVEKDTNVNPMTVTLSNGILTIDTNTRLIQPFESVADGNYTFSIMLSDGTILSASNISVASGSCDSLNDFGGVTGLIVRFLNNNFYIFNRSSGDIAIKAIKVELGSVSTLHLDVAPNYTEELLKCQRYFVRLSFGQYSVLAIGTSSTNRVDFVITLPTQMRVRPTLSTSGTFAVNVNGTDYTLSNITRNSGNYDYITPIYATATGVTSGVGVVFASTSVYIDFDAEIY